MSIKQLARKRRATKTRYLIKNAKGVGLTVFRSNNHIYAQVIDFGDSGKVLAAASSLESAINSSGQKTYGVDAARSVGTLIAERALAVGVTKITFDRNGFNYHGRIKALAEAAREAGLLF